MFFLNFVLFFNFFFYGAILGKRLIRSLSESVQWLEKTFGRNKHTYSKTYKLPTYSKSGSYNSLAAPNPPPLILFFFFKIVFQGGLANFFLLAISLGRMEGPSLKKVINLPRTYLKLPCKGEPYWFKFKLTYLKRFTYFKCIYSRYF